MGVHPPTVPPVMHQGTLFMRGVFCISSQNFVLYGINHAYYCLLGDQLKLKNEYHMVMGHAYPTTHTLGNALLLREYPHLLSKPLPHIELQKYDEEENLRNLYLLGIYSPSGDFLWSSDKDDC